MLRTRLFSLGAGLVFAGALLSHAAAAPAQPTQGVISGAAGHHDYGPYSLSAGLTLLHADDTTPGLFAVRLVLPNPGESIQQCDAIQDCDDSNLVIDEASQIKGTGAVMLDQPGGWYVVVDAPGRFTLSLEQPTPETVQTQTGTSFSGRGMNVSPYFTLAAGSYMLSASSAGHNLRVWLYQVDDFGGGPVHGGVDVYDGRIIDLSFDATVTSAQVNVDAGVYVIAVANIDPTDSWSVSVR